VQIEPFRNLEGLEQFAEAGMKGAQIEPFRNERIGK